MFNPLAVPDSWDDLYLPEKAMARTTPFWACLLWLVYGEIAANGLAWRLAHSPNASTLMVPPLLCLAVALIYFGWLFLDFVNSMREVIHHLPKEQAETLLRAGRRATRLFYSLMITVGMALTIARMLMLSPHG